MKYRKMAPYAAVLLALAPMISVYFAHSLILHLLACIWGFLVGLLYYQYMKRQNEKERKRLLDSFQRTATATLGHHRHDWMNDLQILYGYIQLGKHDKLVHCVERIKERMNTESSISKLGIPALVFYLQSFREVNGSVHLDVEIEEGLQLGDLLDDGQAEELTDAIMDTIRAYQFTGRSSWGEILELKMSMYTEDREVVVMFEQDGNCGNAEMLRQRIEETVQGKRIKAGLTGSPQSSFELRIPC
ncbi:Spo0B domain-containing protein [Paenibacillus sp. J22TS3]|uniref:Spo0B domain-containing protein n=1 Tax=Paenibacillus sp. J22TS3 TaxID=2807192 RepID=UPI001BCDC5CB|nr:Spo0B domain-containing protein [Paenibacillus sp. J22TS3]